MTSKADKVRIYQFFKNKDFMVVDEDNPRWKGWQDEEDAMDRAVDDFHAGHDKIMREIAKGAIWLALIQEDSIGDWWKPGA